MLELSVSTTFIIIIAVSILAISFAVLKTVLIIRQPKGTQAMRDLSDLIHNGAMVFLNQEYKILAVFIFFTALLLAIFLPGTGLITAINFVFGAIFSVAAGNIGMRVATKSNVRTTEAARTSLGKALQIAFSSGIVMGMATVGIGLLGVTLMYLIFRNPEIIYGFGLGASSVAFFARVGGGIFTKSADVGADLVGKIENSIPEDDPRNPAVVADLVGDNVGDVAGMGADLFESYVDSLIAAMVIGMAAFGMKGLTFPLLIASIGIITSIIGTFFVRLKGDKIYKTIDKGTFASGILMIIATFFFTKYYFPIQYLGLFLSTIIGLIAGIIIGYSVEYMTSTERGPTFRVAYASKTGPATNVIMGTSVGMMSTVVPAVTIAIATMFAYQLAGLFGITIAAVGMLSILGVSLAADAYGPVVDNAAGIAEMTKLGKIVRKRTDKLDEVGNTTAAASKGLQLGASALTVLALFASFIEISGVKVIDLGNPAVIAGLLIGGMLPFLFSSLIIKAVGKAAEKMVDEVRRQFKQIKGLLKGTNKPDYDKCITISTQNALKYMILPGVLAIIIPVIVGVALGIEALGGLLIGTIVTGVMLSLYLSTAGGSWDNAKKFIEQGNFGGKGSDAHKAAIVGDTVGDPFKDAAGPSLDILIKLVSITALIFLPLFSAL
ncbi:MAG: sodium-translocating pyrophosphatase [Candidatus Woesearchaeota archaeon]